MHKKRESPLLKSFKNPNAFKKKGNKLLKSLSPIPNYSIQSPSQKGQADELTKTKQQIERSRMISLQYALNYKEPSKQSFSKKHPLLSSNNGKQSHHYPKVILDSAFDVYSQGKESQWATMTQTRKNHRNLSSSSSQFIYKKSTSRIQNDNQGKLFDSNRKNRYSLYGKSTSYTNILHENIKKLENTRNQNQNLVVQVVKKIHQKQSKLEEQRQRFLMLKGIYLDQIRKLTKNLFSKQNELEFGKKGKKSKLKINQDVYKKTKTKFRKRTQTK